ncbi:MAG: OmpA-OmpF porin OOP family, partial [bacterium]
PAAAAVAPAKAAPVAAPAPTAAAAPAAPAPAPAKAAPAAAPVAAAAPAPAPTAAPAANKVILAGDALFQSGKSGIKDLSKEGKAKLDEVVAKLKGMGEIEQIKIMGHADSTGRAAANQKLSEARARSIKSYLVAKGIKPSVIMSSGVGDTQLVVQCDKTLPSAQLKECHAPNRRVEIEIIAKNK